MDRDRTAPRSKTCKSCDQCRIRKVRCIVAPQLPSRCVHCVKRNETCRFSQFKRKLKTPRPVESVERPDRSLLLSNDPQEQEGGVSPPRSENTLQPPNTLPTLYIDRLLADHPGNGIPRDETSFLRTQGHNVTSSGLAFFSERRMRTLSERLGDNRVQELVESIESLIQTHLLARKGSAVSPVNFRKPSIVEEVPAETAKLYIDAYFQNLHCVYPFLDEKDFREKTCGSNVRQLLIANSAFSALYHAVLALGCQYHEGGTWVPNKGKTWRLFQVALGLMPDILVPKESLTNLQALVAMSIFAMNTCCLQVDKVLIIEAARMAQGLLYHKATGNAENSYQAACSRTFWVIYAMEKRMCFQARTHSTISDHDVGSLVPETPEAIFGGYNWFLSNIKFARILSQAYTFLFSTNAVMNPSHNYLSTINEVQGQLECWRRAIPEEFRPGGPPNLYRFSSPSIKLAILLTHFSYYNLVIALARLTLHLDLEETYILRKESTRTLMDAARRVIELTQFIDIAAYTPIFILSVMPLSSLFILFDFVIHNPTHAETRTNLSLLDVAGGHFSLQEYASEGSIPFSIISEFAHIARQYVREVESGSQQERRNSPQQRGVVAPDVTSHENAATMMSGGDNGNPPCGMVDWSEAGNSLYYPITPENGQPAMDTTRLTGRDLQLLFGPAGPEFGFGYNFWSNARDGT